MPELRNKYGGTEIFKLAHFQIFTSSHFHILNANRTRNKKFLNDKLPNAELKPRKILKQTHLHILISKFPNFHILNIEQEQRNFECRNWRATKAQRQSCTYIFKSAHFQIVKLFHSKHAQTVPNTPQTIPNTPFYAFLIPNQPKHAQTGKQFLRCIYVCVVKAWFQIKQTSAGFGFQSRY